ncbi:2-dehydropantoate 2-reductase [Alisedimentitalea sp. MJ-SS2]|uniref:2-dehydropantoate 2-reductase n=1 Tax=Aliisedimentitalea sp. MJ-SS2 TaxID=3049795 RepID=UPI0029111A94|nr:2-dehydropantoate 2-reductase [Alisedimentitalea sp. MJ-SS2]MDU8928106.1 2-dehydropantoate 2-reductase [Alisedimentitalea sp. MJ-SS2]
MTKICIFGAGAIGGMMAHALHKAGAEVSLVARGPHLEAIQEKGLTFIKDGVSETIDVKASDNPADLGEQDYVIITLKAHSVPPIVDTFSPLLGPDTAIVSAVNGVPWWYFHKANSGTDLDENPVETTDPNGAQWHAFGPERAIGCVVYPACEVTEPGTVLHRSGDRFTLGEPSGERTDRAMALSKLLRDGGLRAPVKPRIRDELWIKLWGNCSFNPVSAITGASLDLIGADVASRTVVRNIMSEAREVGQAIGARFTVGIERRIQGGADIIGHKPSTRHDVEQNRPMELDALIVSVQELARRLNIPTPTLDAVSALVRMQGQVMDLYRRRPDLEAIVDGEYQPAD